MLAVVDTNHLSELDRDSAFAARFRERQQSARADVFTTIVTIQEVAKGWLGLLNRIPKASRQVAVYDRFQRSVEVLRDWDILPFDDEAANTFESLQRKRLRVGTMDLKIAAICLAHDATLLTRNQADFEKVPGLRIENWLD